MSKYPPVRGPRLALARAHVGLTQRQLADRLGVTYGHVGHLEKGRAPIDPTWVERLLPHLGPDGRAILLGEPVESVGG